MILFHHHIGHKHNCQTSGDFTHHVTLCSCTRCVHTAHFPWKSEHIIAQRVNPRDLTFIMFELHQTKNAWMKACEKLIPTPFLFCSPIKLSPQHMTCNEQKKINLLGKKITLLLSCLFLPSPQSSHLNGVKMLLLQDFLWKCHYHCLHTLQKQSQWNPQKQTHSQISNNNPHALFSGT